MGRPTGSRNPGFDTKRVALASALVPRVLTRPAPSFRELAESAGVSVPTLRHYFRDRDGAVAAAMEAMRAAGQPYIDHAAVAPEGDLATSMVVFLRGLQAGWRAGVGTMIGAGLVEGVGSAALGPAFVDSLLEPTLQSAEARLAAHAARGQLAACDLRHAALTLVGPVLLALLHQGELGGARCRPLDLDALIEAHVRRFVVAFGA